MADKPGRRSGIQLRQDCPVNDLPYKMYSASIDGDYSVSTSSGRNAREPSRRFGALHSIGNKRLTALLIAASLFWAFGAHAQRPDPLGTLDRFFIPIPAPSVDTTPRSFVINGQRYDIPRNFIESLEKKDDGSPGAISMRAMLPDLSGLTGETLDCLNRQNLCSESVVTIGLLSSRTVVPGSQVLQNIKSFVMPQRFSGPCGLEFYETIGNESQRFRYFFKNMTGDADVSVLWCAKEGSSYAPTCVSDHNPIDEITFYYNFNRKFVCEWEDIRNKIRNRIASFRVGAPDDRRNP